MRVNCEGGEREEQVDIAWYGQCITRGVRIYSCCKAGNNALVLYRHHRHPRIAIRMDNYELCGSLRDRR